jgi:threonine dehydratase
VAQLPLPPAAVVVPVGNGALMGGIGLALGRLAPTTLRVGVVPKQAPVMARSWHAGRVLDAEGGASFADGLAVRVAVPYAVRTLSQAADRMVEVSERAMARAVAAFDAEGIVVEGAAGAALTAVESLGDVPDPTVLVLTGRNIDDERLARFRDEPESFPE